MSQAPQEDVQPPGRPFLLRYVFIGMAAPVLLAIFALWLGQQYVAAEALRGETRAAFNRYAEARVILSHIFEAESSERDFVMSGDARAFERYQAARAAGLRTLDDLDIAFRGNAEQSAVMAQLRRLTMRKVAEMDRAIAHRTAHGSSSAVALTRGGGDDVADRLKAASARIATAAMQEREMRSRRYGDHFHKDALWIATGIGAVGLLLMIAAILLWRQRMAEFHAQMAAYTSAERNRAILESTVEGIAIITPDGMIEAANGAAARMLGYRSDDMGGCHVGMFVKLLDRPLTFHQRINLVDGRIAQPHLPDRTLIRRDGSEVPVDVALGVMRLPDGDHVVASLHDISQRKRDEQRKDELISTVSHELRTPLTSVVGALGLLRSSSVGTFDPASMRLIEIAENNSRRLIRLVNDLLDIDRIKSGQSEFSRQRIDLRQVVSLACEGSEGQAGVAEVEIECAIPETPVDVLGDAERLLQVLSNLASNAIRVSKPGQKVRIGLSVSDCGDGARKATVSVEDDGPGIPAEFHDRIFGRFERADQGRGAGTGLGLAISREIVVRHGGLIWFEDRVPTGTRFAFSLDLAEDRSATPTPPGGARVLICEDDPDIAEMLRLMLDEMGFAADPVGTLAAARAAVRDEDYVALLLDMNLPDGSGTDMIESLRLANGTLPCPVIIVSAQIRNESHRAIANDIAGWIEKPVDTRRLEAALHAALGQARAAA